MEISTLEREPRRSIAFDRFGDGPPVVCIPGLGDTRASYRHLAERLAGAGVAACTLDLRGHGASDVGFGSHSARDIGDVVALLRSMAS